jgi:hypothetical protein
MSKPDPATEILARARDAGLHRFAEMFPDALDRAATGIARHLANVPAQDDPAQEPAHRFAP